MFPGTNFAKIRRALWLPALMVLALQGGRAQDTFSIVAVDTLTGEIGSAGASCVGPIGGVGAFILSDVIEGRGAIHTQAFYNAINQQNAHQRMLLGDSPQQIIDWLVANDAQGDPTIRQYGIVDLTRNGESAAFTGINTNDYKGDSTGATFSVQGNILLGPVIIDTMTSTFLHTPGPLADRLMATLQAAKIIGADTRCAARGTSSQSSFIKVVRLGDGNSPYLQEIVPDSPVGTDPIDILQGQFDAWKLALFNVVDPFLSRLFSDQDSLPADGTSQTVITIIPKNNSDSLLAPGLAVTLSNSGNGNLGPVTDLGNGTYVSTLTAAADVGVDTIAATVLFASDTVEIAQRAVVYYVQATGIGGQPDGGNAPRRLRLAQNYPNPFNPTTRIAYSLPATGQVELIIFNALGQRIKTLVKETQPAGDHQVEWNGRDESGQLLPSGVFYYQLRAGLQIQTRRMTLLR